MEKENGGRRLQGQGETAGREGGLGHARVRAKQGLEPSNWPGAGMS